MPRSSVTASASPSGQCIPICSSCVGFASTIPSTSTLVTSGAASRTARSTALCTVAAEPAQPSQLPSSRSSATPASVDTEVVDAAGVRAEVRTHPVQRLLDAGVDIVGVQSVQHQQVADELVLGKAAHHLLAVGRGGEQVDGALEPFAVELGKRGDELLGAFGHQRVAGRGQVVQQRLDAARQLPYVGARHLSRA